MKPTTLLIGIDRNSKDVPFMTVGTKDPNSPAGFRMLNVIQGEKAEELYRRLLNDK